MPAPVAVPKVRVVPAVQLGMAKHSAGVHEAKQLLIGRRVWRLACLQCGHRLHILAYVFVSRSVLAVDNDWPTVRNFRTVGFSPCYLFRHSLANCKVSDDVVTFIWVVMTK